MAKTIKLRTPVVFEGKTYSRIKLRPAQLRDYLIGSQVEQTLGREFAVTSIVASMADLPFEVIGQLSMEDANALLDAAHKLIPNRVA